MSRGSWEPLSPTSPTSPTNPLDTFLDQSEDVLQWVADWERRSVNMDDKHVEVLISQWKLMRESAKEHSKLFHQMKLAMRDLRGYSMSLQDRLESIENRIRDDMGREQAGRVDSLEKRLREKINQEQANREAEVQELRDLLRAQTRGDSDVMDKVKEHLDRERQAREAGLDAVRSLLAKEAEVLRDVKRHLGDETAAREQCYASLQDRVDRFDRLLADALEKQAALQAAVRADLASEKERREHDIWTLQGRVGQLQEKLDTDLRREQTAREQAMQHLQELIRELGGKEQDLGAIKDLLASERAAREQQARALQEQIARDLAARDAGLGDVRAELLRERAARERLGDSVRTTMDEKLGQHSRSMQERLDHVLRILQGSTGDMLQFWRGVDRGSRGQ